MFWKETIFYTGTIILYQVHLIIELVLYKKSSSFFANFLQKKVNFFFEINFLFFFPKKVDPFEMHSLIMLICVNFPKNLIDWSFK